MVRNMERKALVLSIVSVFSIQLAYAIEDISAYETYSKTKEYIGNNPNSDIIVDLKSDSLQLNNIKNINNNNQHSNSKSLLTENELSVIVATGSDDVSISLRVPEQLNDTNLDSENSTEVQIIDKPSVSKEKVVTVDETLPPSLAESPTLPESIAVVSVKKVTTPEQTQNIQVKKSEPIQKTTSMMVKKPPQASSVLKKQKGDADTEKNLKEVFTSNEKRYSLLKKNNWGLNYDARYSYFRDSRLDIATDNNSSRILRFRVEEDAQHTVSNTLSVQYGLRNNVTVSADLPIIAKTDLVKDAQTVGLGDIGLGLRWEPFPLEKGRLPLIVSGNVSLPTGDSPYDIDRNKSLSTGRGYYGFGGGISTRKYIDPVVLFGSGSMNYGVARNDLSQQVGNGTLVGFKPNLSFGLAVGFAYSLNYDVSLTMSYQQAFSLGSEYTIRQQNADATKIEEKTNSSADQTSATLNMALGVRVSPKTIVNTSIGIGLTEDTPDVSFGVSFPLNFAGFGKK